MWANMQRGRWFSLTCLVLAAATAVLAWPSASYAKSLADTEQAEQITLGRVVYAENCASCHGENLEGEANWRKRKPSGQMPAPPHDETGHTWHHPDEILFGITKMGISSYAPAGYKSDMPAFKNVLSDRDIWAVLAFIKSRWPETILARRDARARRAKQ